MMRAADTKRVKDLRGVRKHQRQRRLGATAMTIINTRAFGEPTALGAGEQLYRPKAGVMVWLKTMSGGVHKSDILGTTIREVAAKENRELLVIPAVSFDVNREAFDALIDRLTYHGLAA